MCLIISVCPSGRERTGAPRGKRVMNVARSSPRWRGEKPTPESTAAAKVGQSVKVCDSLNCPIRLHSFSTNLAPVLQVDPAGGLPCITHGSALTYIGAFGGDFLASACVGSRAMVLTEEGAIPSAVFTWMLVGGRRARAPPGGVGSRKLWGKLRKTFRVVRKLRVCLCVCVVIPFILDVRFVDVPAGVTQDFSTSLLRCLP